ncbi:MAG: DUF4783 domain-containing protein [Carboxylicivirga sp.]|jgi:hypothetical protein|nr:DUF4783 domain-containing protein [Carboxylicivirga sp.]MCT4644257.1 DUF4783 domain-containing protein [Carboxylicivirga sp.]
MIHLKNTITVLIVLFIGVSGFSQQTAALPDGLIMAIKKSDAEAVSKSFNAQVELILPQKSAVYSKKQAEMVIKDFFERNPVKEFKLIHQGKKDKSSFAIANYYASSNRFRFTFLTKIKSGKIYIHQIRIEKQ